MEIPEEAKIPTPLLLPFSAKINLHTTHICHSLAIPHPNRHKKKKNLSQPTQMPFCKTTTMRSPRYHRRPITPLLPMFSTLALITPYHICSCSTPHLHKQLPNQTLLRVVTLETPNFPYSIGDQTLSQPAN